MSEFLRYVLWEFRRYFVLVLLAGVFALGVLMVCRFLHKRKYGHEKAFPWGRVLLSMAFLGYLALVFFVTNLRVSGMSREVNLHLFRGWREALNDFSQQGWLNVLLNIAMFCPFGFLLPLLRSGCRRWYVTIPAGFGFSLVIELLQLIFARGVFDVDDLFCNTLGATMGFFGIMLLLEACGKRWKPALAWLCMTLVSLGGVGSVFFAYLGQEFGNLPQAPAYTVSTRGTVWTVGCELPALGGWMPTYKTQTRSNADCDAFAERFQEMAQVEFEDISYYQEAAYYMNHGSENGAHFLFVHYLDQGYEYSAIYDTEPVWADTDRETLLKALEKYPLTIPESAEFETEGDGWHRFAVSEPGRGQVAYLGALRVRYGADGLVREIDNQLMACEYYRDVEVISPEEALTRLQEGKFNDEGYFERKSPAAVSLLTCTLEYRVDTKGFYQPVYVFEAVSPDGSYRDWIVIPAMK